MLTSFGSTAFLDISRSCFQDGRWPVERLTHTSWLLFVLFATKSISWFRKSGNVIWHLSWLPRKENLRFLWTNVPVRMSWLMPSTEMVALDIPRPWASLTTPLIPRCTYKQAAGSTCESPSAWKPHYDGISVNFNCGGVTEEILSSSCDQREDLQRWDDAVFTPWRLIFHSICFNQLALMISVPFSLLFKP